MLKWYWKELSVIRHGYKTYCQTNNSWDELIDENA